MSKRSADPKRRRRPAARAGGEAPLAGEPRGDRRGPAETPDSAADYERSSDDALAAAKPERRVAARAAARPKRPRSAAPGATTEATAPVSDDAVTPRVAAAPEPGHAREAVLSDIEDTPTAKLREPPPLARPELEAEGLLTNARQLLSTDYYFKQWGRLAMRGRSEQVDDFGLDPTYEARLQPWLDLLYERYFRVKIEGTERIPPQGAALLVCNHAGTLPWDGVVLKTALRHARPGRPGLRWLTDDYVFHSPFLGACLNRIGAVRACPENADRLLARGELLAVFPEGTKGIGKLYRERYQLQRFGRGGHVKLALRMGVPLIPLAIVGGEESYPLLYRLRAFSKALGMPFIPVTPLFPWLGPLGLVPLPSRWHIAVGEPMRELEGLPPSAADDSSLVNDLNEQLRAKVQALLQGALSARGPAFLRPAATVS